MMEIVEFLRARLDEDEAVARAATPGPWRWLPPSGESYPQSDEALVTDGGEWYSCEFFCAWGPGSVTSRGEQRTPHKHEHQRYETVVGAWGYDASAVEAEQHDRNHIARHDPARVLREVGAKRRIVDDLAGALDWGHMAPVIKCVLRSLAAVYAAHPDYRQEWAI